MSCSYPERVPSPLSASIMTFLSRTVAGFSSVKKNATVMAVMAQPVNRNSFTWVWISSDTTSRNSIGSITRLKCLPTRFQWGLVIAGMLLGVLGSLSPLRKFVRMRS